MKREDSSPYDCSFTHENHSSIAEGTWWGNVLSGENSQNFTIQASLIKLNGSLISPHCRLDVSSFKVS